MRPLSALILSFGIFVAGGAAASEPSSAVHVRQPARPVRECLRIDALEKILLGPNPGQGWWERTYGVKLEAAASEPSSVGHWVDTKIKDMTWRGLNETLPLPNEIAISLKEVAKENGFGDGMAGRVTHFLGKRGELEESGFSSLSLDVLSPLQSSPSPSTRKQTITHVGFNLTFFDWGGSLSSMINNHRRAYPEKYAEMRPEAYFEHVVEKSEGKLVVATFPNTILDDKKCSIATVLSHNCIPFSGSIRIDYFFVGADNEK